MWKGLAAAFPAGLAAVSGAAYVATQPGFKGHQEISPFSEKDNQVCLQSPSGLPITANPGVRAHPNVVSPKEAQELLDELQVCFLLLVETQALPPHLSLQSPTPNRLHLPQALKQQYGMSLISSRCAALYKFQQSGICKQGVLPQVNMLRITGRPEAPHQRIPPWKYGDVSFCNAFPDVCNCLRPGSLCLYLYRGA